MPFFEKYGELTGRPNGRPVGVRDGQGQRPMSFENPMLQGMAHTPNPMATPMAPSAPVRQKPVNPGPPSLVQGQVNTLLDWANRYAGRSR